MASNIDPNESPQAARLLAKFPHAEIHMKHTTGGSKVETFLITQGASAISGTCFSRARAIQNVCDRLDHHYYEGYCNCGIFKVVETVDDKSICDCGLQVWPGRIADAVRESLQNGTWKDNI